MQGYRDKCKQEVLMKGRKEIDNKPPYLGHNPHLLLMVLRRHPSYHIYGKCHPKKLLATSNEKCVVL